MIAERENFPPTPSSDLSSDDDDVVVHNEPIDTHVKHTRLRLRLSAIQIMRVERDFPDLWGAIKEIPWEFAKPCRDGIHLQRKAYVGIDRRGVDYINDWMKAHHVQLSHKGAMICEALAFFHEFITWDDLFEYLTGHNWGDLRIDKGLDIFTRKTYEEEIIDANQETLITKSFAVAKPINEADIEWLMSSRKWAREQAIEYLSQIEVLKKC